MGALDLLFVILAISVLHRTQAWAGYLNSAYGVGAVLAAPVSAMLWAAAWACRSWARRCCSAARWRCWRPGSGLAGTMALLIVVGASRALPEPPRSAGALATSGESMYPIRAALTVECPRPRRAWHRRCTPVTGDPARSLAASRRRASQPQGRPERRVPSGEPGDGQPRLREIPRHHRGVRTPAPRRPIIAGDRAPVRDRVLGQPPPSGKPTASPAPGSQPAPPHPTATLPDDRPLDKEPAPAYDGRVMWPSADHQL